jgi:hypothetical protein
MDAPVTSGPCQSAAPGSRLHVPCPLEDAITAVSGALGYRCSRVNGLCRPSHGSRSNHTTDAKRFRYSSSGFRPDRVASAERETLGSLDTRFDPVLQPPSQNWYQRPFGNDKYRGEIGITLFCHFGKRLLCSLAESPFDIGVQGLRLHCRVARGEGRIFRVRTQHDK